jgi:hypothetical protein
MKTQTARGKRAPTASNGSTEFSFSSVALYADKDEYLAKNLIFTIKGVEYQEGAGFEAGSDRWAVTVAPNDGRPDEIITLQSNEKRDELLHAAHEHITKHGPIQNVRLTRSGKAFYFDTVAEAKTL